MTDKQMEKLAEMIFQKLLTRQAEFDKQFIDQLKAAGEVVTFEVYNNDNELVTQNEEEKLIKEYERLSKLLSQYEESEQYEKAAIINSKIRILQNKINKL
jgi:protein-arginine kinase activator protein McsA